jgi:hypothetical protein
MQANTPDTVDIILANDRDRRTLAYLVETCGHERVVRARYALPGRTRPYVSNIAKQLGVTIPEVVVLTPREQGCQQLAEIKKMLSMKLSAATCR